MTRNAVFLSFALLFLVLTSCAPAGQNNASYDNGTTGFKNDHGVDYLHGGDKRVSGSLNQPDPKPAPPPKGKPVKVEPTTANELREQITEFEISRFNKETPTTAVRFGESQFHMTLVLKGESNLQFHGELKKTGEHSFSLNATSGDYALTGSLIDEVPKQSQGEFVLTRTSTAQVAQIFFWAYRAKLTVHDDQSEPAKTGSAYEAQLKELRENTFGWVNNWSVKNGRAFYLVDVIHVIPPKGGPSVPIPVLAFKGESTRTDENDVPATSVKPDSPAQDVEMIGNADEGNAGRAFNVKLEDPSSKEIHEVIIDVEPEEDIVPPTSIPSPTPTPKPTPTPAPAPTTPAPAPSQFPEFAPRPTPRPTGPKDSPQTPVQPESPKSEVQKQPDTPKQSETPKQPDRPKRPDTPAQHAAGHAFLRVDLSGPRTKSMERDFAQNLGIKGVQDWISNYKKGGYRTGLNNFYKFANPFRGIMEAIGKAFDVSPAYAYLTVIESAYFTGGKYIIQKAPTSSALGPFQLLTDTAKEVGLATGGGSRDERRFFAPSACGAAKYMRKLVETFDRGDSTVAILAYFQGDGGAAAVVYCTNAGVANPADCIKKIGRSYSGKDYQRFLKFSKDYSYTYAKMAKLAIVPRAMRDYVNKKLAVYFISNDMPKYGFSVPSDARQRLPTNGTVFPSQAIKNKECRNIF